MYHQLAEHIQWARETPAILLSKWQLNRKNYWVLALMLTYLETILYLFVEIKVSPSIIFSILSVQIIPPKYRQGCLCALDLVQIYNMYESGVKTFDMYLMNAVSLNGEKLL